MPIEVIDKIKQKNGADFKLMDAEDIEIHDTDLKSKINQIDFKLNEKANENDINNKIKKIESNLDEDQNNINLALNKKANKDLVYSKNEIDNFVWNMTNMGQDVKEAMTGGSVAVVKKDSIDTINLKNRSVTNEKMSYINTSHEIIQYIDSFNIDITSPDGEGLDKSIEIKLDPSLWIYFITGKWIGLMGDNTTCHIPSGVLQKDKTYKFILKHNDILLYNLDTNTIDIKNSSSDYCLKANEFLLANCNSGRCNSGILKQLYDSLELKKIQKVNVSTVKNNVSELLLNNAYAYNSNNQIIFEKEGTNVLFFSSMINIRNKLMLNYSWDQIKESFPDDIITVRGNQERFKIPADCALVINKNTKKLELVGYTGIESYHYPLLITVDGWIRGGELAKYDTINKINEMNAKIDSEISKNKSIPDYWNDTLNEKISRIQALQDGSGRFCTSFGFVTDLHYTDNAGHSGFLMEKIMKECDIHNFFCGGDLVNNNAGTQKKIAINCIREFRRLYNNIEDKMLVSLGNHDDNTITQKFSQSIDENTMYSELFRYKDNTFVQGEDGTYFYKDDVFNKIRYISLNCIDVPIVNIGDDKLKFKGQWDYLFRQKQVEWLINVALNVPNDTWSVVVCSHVPPLTGVPGSDNGINNVDAVIGVLKAFAEKNTFVFDNKSTDSDIKMSISCDFRNKGGNIICWLAGHTHYDTITKVPTTNIPVIITLNDSIHAMEGAPIKTVGTPSEQAFDIFTVILPERKVYITRIGAGKDREFTY